MKTLHIAVVDKIATYQQRDGEIVCGNSDYVIEFVFDSEWDGLTEKTARFVIGDHYENVTFSGSTCPVPIITNATSISVGVYAGNLSTTTPAVIGCKKSILCASAAPGYSPVINGKSAYDYAKEGGFTGTEEQFAALLASIDPDNIGGGGSGLPPVTSTDNGKFLRVVDGAWAAVAISQYYGEYEVVT